MDVVAAAATNGKALAVVPLSSRNPILGVRFVATMLLSQLCEREIHWSVAAENKNPLANRRSQI
jgi:hypothetical protein